MLKAIIRLLTMIGTELLEVLRQPLLLLALVLGPFLILLVFGIGHRPTEPPLSTILVIPLGLQLPHNVAAWHDRFGSAIDIVQVTSDQSAAIGELKQGKVNLVVVIPPDAANLMTRGQPATIQVLDNQIDPTQQSYLDYTGYVLASELNQQVIAQTVQRAQQNLHGQSASIVQLRQQIAAIQTSLQSGQVARAHQEIANARTSISAIRSDLSVTQQFVAGLRGMAPGDPAMTADLGSLNQAQTQLATLDDQLSTADAELTSNSQQAGGQLAQADAELSRIQALSQAAQAVSPQVLARPFVSQTRSLAGTQPGFVVFYSPSVLALLLQHLAVTLMGLALVRERQFGTIELYQVAPVSTFGILLGKFLSYAVISGVVAAALIELMVRFLGVPPPPNLALLAGVVALLVFASLSIGLVISLISSSQENAVQYAMLVLLASVFFSGFFLPRNTLQFPASIISDVLPVTYGIEALQDLMLRGQLTTLSPLIALAAIGVVLTGLSVWLFGRELRRR